MKLPKELLLIFAVMLAVVLVTQRIAGDQTAQAEPDLVSDSAAPGGARALYLWLESLGYQVERLEYREFRPGDTARVLLMLAPASQPDAQELDALRVWVERGGALIVAGSLGLSLPQTVVAGTSGVDGLGAVLKKFDLALQFQGSQAEAGTGQPLLLRPPVTSVRVEATSFVTGSDSLVPYLGKPGRPVGAGLAVGKGQVYVLASNYAFSNQALGQADNGALLLNWLPSPDQAGIVLFDEVHHGRADPRSLAYMMTHEPWGWAVLYAIGMSFLYLALEGRRFGRPAPALVDTRRVASEYVVSMAGLLRRGGKGAWVARHYERELGRNLAAACGLDPQQSSPVVAERASRTVNLAGGIGGQEAGQTLLDLHQGAESGISERRLVRLTAEADRIIKACSGRKP